MLIDVCKISKDFGFGELFNSLSFSVNNMDRIALVGCNGCGKSTVLHIIIGKETCNSGSVIIGKNVSLGVLEQTAPDKQDERIVDEILHEPFLKFQKGQQALDLMQEKMTKVSGSELDKLIEKYSVALEKFVADGGYDVEQNINYVVGGLKIGALQNRVYSTLSGGEKTLVHFAKILLDSPDVLLLDEPTNHLDIERIEWLEGYLSKYKGACIVVSHDRYFLDKVATKVIDLEDGGEIYVGNYSHFVKEKEEKELKEFEQYKNEQKKLEQLKLAVNRLYEWGRKADNPSMFKRAKAIQKRIDFIEENGVNKPKQKRELKLNLDGKRGSDVVFDIKNFSLILGDKILFENASVQIRNGYKVALVGLNGTGKTSLIKCIMGQNSDYMGTISIGGSIKIGYLPQLLIFEDDGETILSYVENMTGYNAEESRRLLAKYGFFKDDIDKTVGKLSGGEKVRVKIACMLTKDINTLVFDEPTNHIDIATRETLEEALQKFNGNILFVSHDRYFINNVANKILELKDGKLHLYDGNYDAYINKDIVKPQVVEKLVKIKPPKISKGGKW